MKFIKELTSSNNVGIEIKKHLNEYKVIVVRSSNFKDDVYWEHQAHQIGDLVPMQEDFQSGNKTGVFWTDIKYDKNLASSFSHSNTRQPLHTDGAYESNAPNITFFYCLNPAKKGGATTCIDIDEVIECLELEAPHLLEALQREEVLFHKGNDCKKTKILNNNMCNWNYFRAEKCNVVEDFHAFLENRIMQMGLLSNVSLGIGDAVFFNDQQVLHGRNAFIGERWLRKGGIKWSG